MRTTQQTFPPFCNSVERDAATSRGMENKGPCRLPPVAGLDYYGECHPAQKTGGDFFDFLAPRKSTLMLSIGDVSGGSSSTAVVIGGLQASTRALASNRRQTIAGLVQELNRILCNLCTDRPRMTMFLAQIDSERREVNYVNAGHEPALLIRDKARQIVPLPGSGAVLGMTPQAQYEQKMIALQPGDILVALTDGVADSGDSDDCAIHEQLLLDIVRRNPRATASDLVGRILQDVESRPHETAPPDDRTVVVVRLLAGN